MKKAAIRAGFFVLAILTIPAFGRPEESEPGDSAPQETGGHPCEGLQDLAFSWGPKTGLLLAGRLDSPCQDFSIRVRDVDSDKLAILEPTIDRGISDEEGTGSFVLRFKDPGSHVLEVGFHSGGIVGPQCLVSRQPDPFWRLMCASPHPGEAEASFWLEALGLIPAKGKKQDMDKEASGNLWGGGLVWRVDDDGTFSVDAVVVGEGSDLPSQVDCRVTLLSGSGEAPLVARSQVHLAGASPRLWGDCKIEMPLPLWMLGRTVEVIFEIDPYNTFRETFENDNATVAASLMLEPDSTTRLLAGGMTAGPKGNRLKGHKGNPNLKFENLVIRKTRNRIEAMGFVSQTPVKNAGEESMRLRIWVTGLLGFPEGPTRVQKVEISSEAGKSAPFRFTWPLEPHSESKSPDTRSPSLALQIDAADQQLESDENDNEVACTVTLGALDTETQPFCSDSTPSALMGFLRLPGFQEDILMGKSTSALKKRNLGDLRFVLPQLVWGRAGKLQVRGTLIREPGKSERAGETLSIPIRIRYLTGDKVAAEVWKTAGMETGTILARALWAELFVPGDKIEQPGAIEIAIDPDNQFPEDEEQNNLIFLKRP